MALLGAHERLSGRSSPRVILLSLVSAPFMPLIDAYALKGLGLRGRAYGPVRLWGSVAFIAANLAGGLLLDLLAPTNLIWLIFAGNCAVAAAALRLVPLPRDEARARRAATGHSHLRQPAFLAIAAAGKPDPGEPRGLLRLRDARLDRARVRRRHHRRAVGARRRRRDRAVRARGAPAGGDRSR